MTQVKKETLANGLTVITEAMPSALSVCIGIWLRIGSRHERPQENGISHFLEHMVFKGTENRSAEQIARAADAIGGHLDAFTAKETTGFTIKALDEHLPRAFDILSDLVKRPLFLPADITRESRVVREEIKMAEDTPDDLVQEIFTQSYWREHALGRPILGTRQTVAHFDRKKLRAYFHRYYTPANMLVTAAGRLEHARVVELVGKEFGDAPSGKEVKRGAIPVACPNIKLRDKKDLEQAHVLMGAPSYPQSHPKRYAAYVLNTVLGGGMSSRLFQHIREQRGLAYSVYSAINAFYDTGCFGIYAGTAAANVRVVLDLILKELAAMKAKPLGEEELARAKEYLKGSMLLALESTSNRMAGLARHELYFGRSIPVEEIAAGIDAVNSADVQSVARELFLSDRLALTVLGPLNHLKISRADLAC
jgi:predicted Zn-dependent peptidase